MVERGSSQSKRGKENKWAPGRREGGDEGEEEGEEEEAAVGDDDDVAVALFLVVVCTSIGGGEPDGANNSLFLLFSSKFSRARTGAMQRCTHCTRTHLGSRSISPPLL